MLWKRIIGAAGGLALATGSLLALSSPAQAVTPPPAISDCDGLTFTVTPNADHRAWRAVVDGTVVWTSGDFGEDLGGDHEELVDNGWTEEGPFEVYVRAEDARHGTVTLQWWHTNPPEQPNGWQDWSGGEWVWEKPEYCPVEPEEPGVTQPTCDHPQGIITIPEVPGVQYLIDGEPVEPGKYLAEPGAYEVTAEPAYPYELSYGDQDRWQVVITPKECPEEGYKPEKPEESEKPEQPEEESEQEALPVTGGSAGLASGAALALLALGTGVFYLARTRRIRFTA